MFYLNEDYNNYKYLVELSDNYIILTDESSINGSWDTPDTIDVIYQYFYPSTQVIETEYSSNYYRSFDNVSSQITNDFYYRPDASNFIFTGGLFIFWACLIITCVTTLIHKGGLFFDK